MPAQATENAPDTAQPSPPLAPPQALLDAITDAKPRAAVRVLSSGIPVMDVRRAYPYSDAPWDENPIVTIPVPDIYASRDALKAIYTPDTLQTIAHDCMAKPVKCQGCGLHNLMREVGAMSFRSYDGEYPVRSRKYFPFTMNGFQTRQGNQYLCSDCANTGYIQCRHCGIVTKSHRRTQSCAECYKVHAVRNRRSRDTFITFRRTNPAYQKPDDGAIYYGIELEYSDIEGQKRLSEFMKTDAFPFSSTELAVKGDGSVSHGFEINAGKGTYEQVTSDIAAIAKALQFFPHTGNRAGYHIHASFDTRSPEREKLYYRVASLYSAIEPLLFAAIPAWRKDNDFAKQTFDSFKTAGSITDNYSTDRYRALNMTAMRKYGTLEWRMFPSSSNAGLLTGYLSIVQWLMSTVWERRDENDDQWSKRYGKMENAREYLTEAFMHEDAPNFRFMARALASLSIPPAVMDFIVERIGYNIVQKIKNEKESAQKSVFTDRDRSLPAYSYETDRNTKTMAALKNAFKKEKKPE